MNGPQQALKRLHDDEFWTKTTALLYKILQAKQLSTKRRAYDDGIALVNAYRIKYGPGWDWHFHVSEFQRYFISEAIFHYEMGYRRANTTTSEKRYKMALLDLFNEFDIAENDERRRRVTWIFDA